MNATGEDLFKALLNAGVSAATLSRLADVQRSSATRWTHGARPRGRARARLATAAALLEGQPAAAGLTFGSWLDTPNQLLTEKTPAAWIREDRDWTMLEAAWTTAVDRSDRASRKRTGCVPPVGVDGRRIVRRLVAGVDLRSAELMASLAKTTAIDTSALIKNLVPMIQFPIFPNPTAEMGRTMAAAAQAASIDTSDLTKDLARSLEFLELTSSARQVGRMSAAISESLRGLTDGYAQAAQHLSGPDLGRAFLGTQDLIAAMSVSGPIFDQAEMLAKLVGDTRPAIGSLALGIDLQLSSPIVAALASRPALRRPYLLERSGWERWVPRHPKTLTRSDTIQTEWLLGETHNASQASVAALGRRRDGSDSAEISAALTGVTLAYPDLLAMRVPGTGFALKACLKRLDPRIADSLEGAVNRLREGGPDCGRQAAASLRAALDQLADALIPGSKKKGRLARYAEVLGVAVGNTEGTLLYYQIGVLDAAHEPLSKRVHDRVDDDALRAVAFGIFSAFAAVLSRWVAQGERPLPKG